MSSDSRKALAAMSEYQPVPWEMIPDLGLYMDQVITFIARMVQPLYGEDMRGYLSAPMINNYVKDKLIPRPVGKKYSREQIALLTMIVALKQVSSMDDIRQMLILRAGESVEQLYTDFCGRFSRAVHAIAQGDAVDFGGLTSARDFAILASALRAGCSAALKDEPASPEV